MGRRTDWLGRGYLIFAALQGFGIGLTGVFGALGLVLLLLPDITAGYWPWNLPPVLGQLYGCFILTFSVGAALASRETEPIAVRDFVRASLALCVLVLVVSAIHFDRFKPA